MVWRGMVWYGMVWYGVEWIGMAWNGMVWRGIVWNGMEWHGIGWNGLESDDSIEDLGPQGAERPSEGSFLSTVSRIRALTLLGVEFWRG